MKILFLTDGIAPYVTGGMQQFSAVLVKLLLDQDIEITLVHCGEKGEVDFDKDIRLIFTNQQSNRLETVFIPFKSKGNWPGHYLYENKKYSELIYNQFRKSLNDFDFIYAQGFTGWAFGKKKMKPKLLVNFHGFEMYQKAPNFKVKLEHYLLRPFVKLNCLNADYVYSFGGKITDIIKSLGVEDHKILNQSNGIENKWLSKPKISSKPLSYIFIGRNERRKGIEELSEALLILKRNNQLNFNFTFIGPIPPQEELKNQVTYLGEIKNQNLIHEHLKSADVLVCPSHAEGMPTVILEAMANGLVIITSDVGASSKMIDGNGVILTEISSNLISTAITDLNNKATSEINLMKNKSYEMAASLFIWEKIALEMVSNLERITTS